MRTQRWKSVRATIVPLLLLIAAGRLDAQEQRHHCTSRGTWEFGGSVSYLSYWSVVNDNTSSSSTFVFSAMPFAGYFILDGLELGINPAGIVVSGGTGLSTVTRLRMLFAPSYNLKTGSIAVPFLEGLAGVTTQTTDAAGGSTTTLSGFTWGGRAGVKLAITEHGLLNVGVQYLLVTLNPSGVTARNGSNELSASLGWTVWL